jgi:phosphoribosyl 1,2-cyclic phosphodiesterase
MEEIWKDIKGYEGCYQISNKGRIKSFLIYQDGYIRSNKNQTGDYLRIILKTKTKTRSVGIHILVAEHFIGERKSGIHVHHIDGNKQNNCVENLIYISSLKHRVITMKENPDCLNGMINYNKYIRPKRIQQFDLKGNYIADYPNGVIASKVTGVCHRNILQVASKSEYLPGKIRKQAGGYIWKYKKPGMQLKILGSSSSGNCYLFISSSGEILMVEAGIDFKEVKKQINFNLSGIKGVIYSHEHFDHSRAVKDILNYSIPVYSSKEAIEAIGIKHHNLNAVKDYEIFNVGKFRIKTFPLRHDVKCIGFLIMHPEMGLTAFITDTYYVHYRFKVLNHVLIEVNYSRKIANKNIAKGNIPLIQYKRILSSHMELETALKMLRANDLSTVVNIVLLHLSDDNSNAELFKKEIEFVTGKPVYIADKGLEISLNKEGF